MSEVKAKPEYHRFLIGRGGANIRKVRDSTGARIIFPNSTDADQESITLIGKKEAVELAKVELESLIKDLVSVMFVIRQRWSSLWEWLKSGNVVIVLTCALVLLVNKEQND